LRSTDRSQAIAQKTVTPRIARSTSTPTL
jgi:hypothetical protein